MPEIEIPFATQAGESSVRQNSAERLVNMYAELETSGRKRILRRQRAGMETEYAITGEKRCIEHYNGVDYIIVADKLYSYDGAVLAQLATLSSDTGRCWIVFNDNGALMISDNVRGYNWDGATLTTITTPGGVEVGPLAFLGGFGIFLVPGTAQFYITALNDFTTIDALDFATAEAAPDPLLRIFVDHNQILLCGTQTIEPWQLTGGSDFPFQPLTNTQIQRGLAARNAIASEDNTSFFIGADRVIYRLEGYRPMRISTGPIERAIAAVSAAAMDACEAFVYTSGGQKFVTFRFPGELTIQFNLGTQLWNYASTYTYDDWRLLGSAGYYNRFFLTDAGMAKLNETLNVDEGGIMLRKAVSAPGDANGLRISVGSLILDAEVGRAAIGKNATVMMRFAPDGETFGSIRERSLGATGQYQQRAVWRQCGMGRRPTIELSISDDVRFSVMAAICDAEAETD